MAARGGIPFDPLRQRAVVVAEANRGAARLEKQEADVNLNRYQELLKTGDVSEAAVDQARSRVAAANTQLAVTSAQYESALAAARTTPDQVGVARANVASARAAVRVAEANLEQCKVRSPIAGYVIARSASPGAYLAPGSAVATVAQTDPIVMEALIPEGQEMLLTPGMKAVIEVPSFPGKAFPGTLRELSRALDVASRSVIARIDIPNPGGALRPGMFATAEVSLPRSEPALYVPASAVHNPSGDGTLLVYVARGQRLEAAIVRAGSSERPSTPAGMVRIYSGLATESQVVIGATGKLADGVPFVARQ
ncbi:MAG: efflux RND transporter periplasmic adaptor subunit [Bryobacterales bacterium]|nr:efflux RND transporter periplasmic adaptor subunit [Bryobacterales bacterium]